MQANMPVSVTKHWRAAQPTVSQKSSVQAQIGGWQSTGLVTHW
jgi:hypothetical protein